MSFVKYQHIERIGTDETDGIMIGTCYIFPKIDGTNASAWAEDGEIAGGSRQRVLSINSDNAGFYEHILKDEKIYNFLQKYPDLRLYGEWLVPHSLKTYRKDVWRKFYIFDVCKNIINVEGGLKYLPYEEYVPMLEEFGIDYIPVQTIIINPSLDQLYNELTKNQFLIEDGKGAGEGIVIKNYQFVNKYGRQTWAKIVTSEFKDKHRKEMGPNILNGEQTFEIKVVNEFCTETLIDKVYAKIINEHEGWSSKYIPQLLNTVYHDLITEEMWSILKKYGNVIINFKELQMRVTNKIKEYKNELF